MGLLLALTLPLHLFWTRKNPDYRVTPSELISEIKTRGYVWHISLYLAMFLFKAFTDYHNEPLKAMVGGFTHVVYSIEADLVFHIQERFRNDLVSEILSFTTSSPTCSSFGILRCTTYFLRTQILQT